MRREGACGLGPRPGPFARVTVGDPVDVVTGAEVDRVADFFLAGEPPIEWLRSYDSRDAALDRGLGRGHRHGFDSRLCLDLDGIGVDLAGEGELRFGPLHADGAEARSSGFVLARLRDDLYELRQPGGPSLRFLRHADPYAFPLAQVLYAPQIDGPIDGGREPPRLDLRYDEAGRLRALHAWPSSERLEVEWTVGPDPIGRIAAVSRLIPERPGSEQNSALQPLIRYLYDERGLLTEGVDAFGHRFQFGYDAEGRLARRTDRAGYSFHFQYDAEGRVVRSFGEDGVLDVQLRYEPELRRTTVTDAGGGRWLYGYRADGQLESIVDPLGGVRRYEYDEEGQLRAEVDEIGRRTERVEGEPVGPRPRPAPQPSTALEWELGDLWLPDLLLPHPGALPADLPEGVRSGLVWSEDPLRGQLRERRDLSGALEREELEDGRSRTYERGPNRLLVRFTDLDGGVHQLHRASFNHVVAVTDPLGHQVLIERSKKEETTAVTDPTGVKSEYRRDPLGRITELHYGGSLKESYRYDPAGNLTHKFDAHSRILLTMSYDSRGFLSEKKLESGEEYRFEHDDNGQLISALIEDIECTFSYDEWGRREDDKRNGLGIENRRFIDGGRHLETRILDRFTILQREVSEGLVEIRDPSGGVHRVRRHGAGLYTRDLADGLSETAQYAPTGRCLYKGLFSRGSGALLWARRFRYSGEMDLLAVEDSARGVTRYQHDAAHRLRWTTHPDGSRDEHLYSESGGLYAAPGLRAELGPNNQLRSANGAHLEYDLRGHLTARVLGSSRVEYERDSSGRLLSVCLEGPEGRREWSARYDPLGRRIEKVDFFGRRTEHYWDGDRLAAEILPGGHLRIYVYPDEEALVPMLFVEYPGQDSDAAEGRRYALFGSHLGAPERVYDQAGQLVWSASFAPYGLGRIELGEGFHQPLRWPGHYFDEELGLHYNRNRYYSPEMGRYLESDPIGIALHINVYSYTDNPLNHVDINGLGCSEIHEPSPEEIKGNFYIRKDGDTIYTFRRSAANGWEVTGEYNRFVNRASYGLMKKVLKRFREKHPELFVPKEKKPGRATPEQARLNAERARIENEGYQRFRDALSAGTVPTLPHQPGRNLVQEGAITPAHVAQLLDQRPGRHFEVQPADLMGQGWACIVRYPNETNPQQSWYFKWYQQAPANPSDPLPPPRLHSAHTSDRDGGNLSFVHPETGQVTIPPRLGGGSKDP